MIEEILFVSLPCALRAPKDPLGMVDAAPPFRGGDGAWDAWP